MEWRNGSVGLINVGESLGRVWISNRCWCMWWVELARGVCVCVCVCVCVRAKKSKVVSIGMRGRKM